MSSTTVPILLKSQGDVLSSIAISQKNILELPLITKILASIVQKLSSLDAPNAKFTVLKSSTCCIMCSQPPILYLVFMVLVDFQYRIESYSNCITGNGKL